MRLLKKLARRTFASLGYDVVPRGAGSRIVLRDALESLFRRESVSLVFDVGANIGQFRDYLRTDLSYDGRIISFEPSPAEYEICAARADDDPLWEVHPWALGAETATLGLNILEASDLSSFRRPAQGETPFNNAAVLDVVEVPVRRLDDVIEELGIDLRQERALVKADTQGFDLEVFRGGPKAMSQAVGLLSEVAQLQIYEQVPDFLEAIAELRAYGFMVAALAPVTFHRDVVLEYDCLMIRAE